MPNLILSDYESVLDKIATKRPSRRSHEKFLRNLFIFLVMVFLFLPIMILVMFSFNESKMNVIFTGFTFEWYGELFKNPNLLEAFRNTIFIAVLSTTISTIIGTISAVGLKKYNFFGEKFIGKLIYIPIVIPEIVLGISLLAIFTLFKLELGFWTVLLAHISFSIPFVITSVRSTLYSFSPSIEEAAEDLGASRLQTLLYVTLPIIKPGIISGAILAFTLSMDDVVISYFTAGPGTNTLPLYIYSNIKTGISPDVNALTTLMLIATITLLVLSNKIETRRREKRELR
ncbi:ABC transporter permease [Candidatus Saccharibacteria bacterium]|nr:ABC transporter permease [Candidatus Saccharibacteria bacterium]